MIDVQDILKDTGKAIHMVGVGGVGMSGLACLLSADGHHVTGCDQQRNELTDWLEGLGIPVAYGHASEHISPDLDAVVRSTAISPDHVEIQRAQACDVPVYQRGEVLAAQIAGVPSIAVSGTHGKTTTTAMLVHMLKSCGHSPSFAVGGWSESLGGVAGVGNNHELVCEADESDGTLARYEPSIAVVTNIEFDHMEHFNGVEEVIACFRCFLDQSETAIYCADDPVARRLGEEHKQGLGYGFAMDAPFRGEITRNTAAGSRCNLYIEDRIIPLSLPVAGRHNVLNALAAMAAAREFGVPPKAAARALADFHPVRRRFEDFSAGGIRVISDYAHHPTEIRALLEVARMQQAKRILAVFQPHRYTRTAMLGEQFPAAFEGVDQLIICPVYAASEAPVPGGWHTDLLEHFKQVGYTACETVDSLESAWAEIEPEIRPGDLLLIIGAGDVEQLAHRARRTWEHLDG